MTPGATRERAGKRRSVAVRIAGQRFVIKSDEDEAHINALAHYVDGKIAELQQATRTVSTLDRPEADMTAAGLMTGTRSFSTER